MKLTIGAILLLWFAIQQNLYSEDLCGRNKAGFYSPDFVQFDSTIDVTYYFLYLRLTANPNYLYGSVNVKGKFNTPGNRLFLNFKNVLSVDSVNGYGVSGFAHSNDLLSVLFSGNENEFDITVHYKGLPSGSGFGSFVFSSQNSVPIIWSLSEPYGASDWFPNKNTPSDKADSSQVWITCPSNLVGVSNGLLYETLNNPDNTKTYKWKSKYPISSYLISIAVTNYAQYNNYFKYSSTDSMVVNHYVYPTDLNALKNSLDVTPKMLQLFSDKYSLYPFIKEKYGHAQFGWGGAMEHQTISSMGSFGQGIVAHELAHQWFGDKVTCRDFNNIWLNEGFATFSESLWIELNEGKEAYISSIKQRMANARKAEGTLYVYNTNNVNEIFNSNRTYSKGAVVVHMLRGVLGDSTFFNVLKSYINDSTLSYSTAVTEDLQRVAEKVSGKNLNYFFQQWIYGENYPVYNISFTKSQNQNGSYNVNVTLSQKINTNPTFFTMPVDIKITTSAGDTTFTVFNNSQIQTFNLLVKDNPYYITIDPDNKILKDKKGDDPVESIDFKLFQNYPNPFNPTTNITYMIKQSGYVNLILYDINGKEIKKLVSENQKPGTYSINLKSDGLSSGVYFYKLTSGNLSGIRKMILLR